MSLDTFITIFKATNPKPVCADLVVQNYDENNSPKFVQ